MNENIIYIGEQQPPNNHAGNKARDDVDAILNNVYGAPIVNFYKKENATIFEKIRNKVNFNYLKKLVKLLCLSKRNIIIQYPLFNDVITNMVVMNTIKQNNVIFFVHDLRGLRTPEIVDVSDEIELLNYAKLIVTHNKRMTEEVKRLGYKGICIELNLFDYLLNDFPKNDSQETDYIAFAGNLGKSEFLYSEEIKSVNMNLNLYGPNYLTTNNNSPFFEYKGSFKPNEVPYKLKGKFGLIWDGTSIYTCDGIMGEYTKINNPHKLSLYIAAGLPVIVWKEAAIAKFVEENNIGFTIKGLKEISSKLNDLNEDTYEQYLINIKKIQKKVCNGCFTKMALDKVEKYLEC